MGQGTSLALLADRRRIAGLLFLLGMALVLVPMAATLLQLPTDGQAGRFLLRSVTRYAALQADAGAQGLRALVMAAIAANALGIALLGESLKAAGEATLSRLAVAAYLVGGAAILVAEIVQLSEGQWIADFATAYVLLALVSQMALGLSLWRTALAPRSVGVITVGWNVGWLLLLVSGGREDIYYPVLHQAMPVLIGAALLLSRGAGVVEADPGRSAG